MDGRTNRRQSLASDSLWTLSMSHHLCRVVPDRINATRFGNHNANRRKIKCQARFHSEKASETVRVLLMCLAGSGRCTLAKLRDNSTKWYLISNSTSRNSNIRTVWTLSMLSLGERTKSWSRSSNHRKTSPSSVLTSTLRP